MLLLMRSLALFLIIFTFTFIFYVGIIGYTSELSNPIPMQFGFGCALLVTVIYEIKGGLNKSSFVSVATSSVLFGLAPFLAVEIKEIYLSFLINYANNDEITEIIGVEYIRAIQNPAIGLGSSFGLALAVIRLVLGRFVQNLISRIAYANVSASCQLCGRPIEHARGES